MITSFFLLRPSRLPSGAGTTQELAKLGPFNSRVQETLRHRLFVNEGMKIQFHELISKEIKVIR